MVLAIHCSFDVSAKQVVFVRPTKPVDWHALTNTLSNSFFKEEKRTVAGVSQSDLRQN